MISKQNIARQTAEYLLQINAIKLNPKNPFIWASGWRSPIYCDNRIALSFPRIRTFLADSLTEKIKSQYGEQIVIAGVATGAIGIGILVAQQLELPFIYVRPEPKKHGRKNQIEGQLTKGQKVVVIEDLISTGKSSLNAVVALQEAGADVLGMWALFTYGFETSKAAFQKANINLQTLCDYQTLVESALHKGTISDEQAKNLQNWSEDPAHWSLKS